MDSDNELNNEYDICILKFINFMKLKICKKDNETNKYLKSITHMLHGNLHNELYPYKGSFHIVGKDYEIFKNLYNDVVGKMKLHIIERPNENGNMVGPYIIDIDYKTKKKERLYNKNHIEKIINICNYIFKKYLCIDNDNILKAFVLEKPEPSLDVKNNLYKDGFHIHYNIPLSCDKRFYLYEKIKSKIKGDDIFDDIDHESSYDDIVDHHVIKDNGMLMYYSSKENREPYKLTYVYIINDNKLITEDISKYNQLELINIFSLQKYSDNDDINFLNKYENEIKKIDIKKQDKEKKPVEKIEKKNNTSVIFTRNEFAPKDSYNLNELPNEYKILFEYIDILSPKRASEYNSWIRVCWALHGISPRLYNMFIYFSKKGNNFDEKGCIKEWNQANKNGIKLTISSIKLWAKEDNLPKYNEIYFNSFKDLATKIETPNHNDIADVIVSIYNDIYKCTNLSKNHWYEFQNHRWVFIENGYTLQEKISTEVSKEFLKISTYFSNKAISEDGQKHDDAYKKMLKIIETTNNLKNQNYSSTLIKTCGRKFKIMDPKFDETLDSNYYLIGFDNGVFDLSTMTFRDGVPDDKLTLNTGYSYTNYNINDPIITNIMDFIKKIQPDEKMREYILRLFSSCLDGKNKDQQFRIFEGSGSNGKSKLIDLLSISLGKYASSLPSEILTIKNNNANSATPFLADKNGVRLLTIQEPEGDATLQVGKMKGLSGGDKVPARKLFGEPFEFVPQFKIFLICNKLPKIPSDDGGTWRRIRVAHFPSKFVKKKSDVDESKHHYLADKSIDEEKLKQWAPAFMWLLINVYYPKYILPDEQNGGLCEPDDVIKYSEKYRENSDQIYEFIKDMLIISNNIEDKIEITSLYSQFKSWCKDNHTQGTKLTKKEFTEYFEEKMKLQIQNKHILGIKLSIDLTI